MTSEKPRKPLKPVKPALATAEELRKLSLAQIASLVRRDWLRPYFGAVPYLEALHSLETVNDAYGINPGRQIVGYFLANAQTYRGPTAKLVKTELNRRLKSRAA